MYTYKKEIICGIVRNLAFARNNMEDYEKKKGVFWHSIAQVALLPDEGQTEGDRLKQEDQLEVQRNKTGGGWCFNLD